MDFLKNRKYALDLLNDNLDKQTSLINEVMAIIDQCIDLFDEKSENDEFYEISGFTLVKAKYYSLAIYSLILDGLGQESGALLKPLFENIELLSYFRHEPERILQVYNDILPGSEERSKVISNNFKELHDYLKNHTSYVSYSKYTLINLINKEEIKFQKTPNLKIELINNNLKVLFAFLYILGNEAINCLNYKKTKSSNELYDNLLKLKAESEKVFGNN